MMKRIAVAASLAFGVLCLATPVEVRRALLGRWSFVDRQVNQDLGYFYRVKVRLSHGDENLDFNYVVACNIRVTRWKDGGLSDDTRLTPERMYRATASGAAVMVKTPALCGLPGRPQLVTETGWVPPDLLPLVIWFDDAKDLSHGWGYVSETAYESPLAKLKFGGAHISVSSRDEWVKWREKAKADYVQIGDLPGAWGETSLEISREVGSRRVHSCYASIRRKLPYRMRQAIREFVPQGKEYWWLGDLPPDQIKQVLLILEDKKLTAPPAHPMWRQYTGSFADGWASGGLPLRSGRQVQSPPHVPSRWAADYFPILPPGYSTPLPDPTELRRWRNFQFTVLIDEQQNGFALCGRNYISFLDPQDRPLLPPRGMATMSFGNDVVYRVPGILAGLGQGQVREAGQHLVFRQDEYVYYSQQGF